LATLAPLTTKKRAAQRHHPIRPPPTIPVLEARITDHPTQKDVQNDHLTPFERIGLTELENRISDNPNQFISPKSLSQRISDNTLIPLIERIETTPLVSRITIPLIDRITNPGSDEKSGDNPTPGPQHS